MYRKSLTKQSTDLKFPRHDFQLVLYKLVYAFRNESEQLSHNNLKSSFGQELKFFDKLIMLQLCMFHNTTINLTYEVKHVFYFKFDMDFTYYQGNFTTESMFITYTRDRYILVEVG